VGPQHLINIKRLAYVARKPEEAFEMPLDYNAAAAGVAGTAGPPIDRGAVVAAVERYLASRGIAVAAPAQAAAAGASSCGCGSKPVVQSAVIGTVAAEVVDRFLARRGGGSQGGYG